MTQLYTLENFTNYLNSHFEIRLEGHKTILLELSEAKEIIASIQNATEAVSG